MHRHSLISYPCTTPSAGLLLIRAYTKGEAVSNTLSYTPSTGDEVEDLYRLIQYAKKQLPNLEGVCSGAIASDYQRLRVESVCARLGLISIAPLWRRSQMELLESMIEDGMEAILVKVAAEGLIPQRHVGRSLREMKDHLVRLREMYGCNVCGEGGEYETLVLDASIFKFGKIVIDKTTVIQEGSVAPIGMLEMHSFHVDAKIGQPDLKEGKVVIVPEADDETSEDGSVDVMPGASTDETEDVELVVSEAGCLMDIDVRIRSSVQEDQLTPQRCLALQLTKLKTFFSTRNDTVSLRDIVFVQLYLKDMKFFGEINAIYRRHFPIVDPPSRACVELKMQHPCRLRIRALKASLMERRVLHVQSISAWAPCCIGPYSQATSIDDVTFVAGQLGLRPLSMDFSGLDWRDQIRMSLQHCQSVAIAVGGDLTRSTIKITIYLSIQFATSLTDAGKSEFKEMMQWPFGFLNEMDNDAADGDTDDYLRKPKMGLSIEPLLTFVVVPALPKNAMIEIQPVLFNTAIHSIDTINVVPFNDIDKDADFMVQQDSACNGNGPPVVQCLSVVPIDLEWRRLLQLRIIYRVTGMGFVHMSISKKHAMDYNWADKTSVCGRMCGRLLKFCLHCCGLTILSSELWFDASVLNEQTCQSLIEAIESETQDDKQASGRWTRFASDGVGIDASLDAAVIVDVFCHHELQTVRKQTRFS